MIPSKIIYHTSEGVFGTRVAGLMVHNSRVLLCRLVEDDIWVIPGGGINLHETSHEAVKGEFMEEAELEIEVDRLLWVIENFFVLEPEKERCHGIELYFLVSASESESKLKQDEFHGEEDYWEDWKVVPGKTQPLIFKWFAPDEIDGVNLKPDLLKKLLKEIPDHTMHIVNKES